ncbi:MAG: hypothetical protein AAF519_17435 [Bacteroidota bacterium]
MIRMVHLVIMLRDDKSRRAGLEQRFQFIKGFIDMVTIDSFLEEELNDHSRKVILAAIQDGEKSLKEKEEIVFNRFSLDISFAHRKVSVYDDVFSEDEPLELSLEDFIEYVKK